MNVMKLASFALLGLTSSLALAAPDDLFLGSPDEAAGTECEQDCEAEWVSSVEVGIVSISGNTETDTTNARFAVSYEKDKWRHAGFLSSNKSSTHDKLKDTQTDAEKFTAQVKSDYQLTKKSYTFGIFDYDETKDSGFEYQSSLAVGLGYRFIKTKVHKLDGELGLGTRRSRTEETLLAASETKSESIYRIAGLYKWKISKTANFEQSLSSEIGEDNTITKSSSSLSAQIIENLSLKVAYTLKHQSEVPLGNEKKETITSLTVVYSF